MNQARRAVNLYIERYCGQMISAADQPEMKRDSVSSKIPTWREAKDLFTEQMLIYASGIRVTECVRLRVQDLDFGNQALIVRSGKGDKDRVTLLPEFLHERLYTHLL